MRTLFVILALAAAGPAAAQATAQSPRLPPQALVDLQRDRDAHTVAGMQAAKEHDTSLKNDLSTLQATAETQQVLADIAAAGRRPALPAPPANPKAPPPRLDEHQLAEIPNAALAASNARAVAASENRK